jgi:hypothetical protein
MIELPSESTIIDILHTGEWIMSGLRHGIGSRRSRVTNLREARDDARHRPRLRVDHCDNSIAGTVAAVKRSTGLLVGLLWISACSQSEEGSDTTSEMTQATSDTSDSMGPTSDESDGGPNLGPCPDAIVCCETCSPETCSETQLEGKCEGYCDSMCLETCFEPDGSVCIVACTGACFG